MSASTLQEATCRPIPHAKPSRLPDSTFGGYKQAGIGREMGLDGLREFQESKSFATVV
ncbi:hypothetical protein [Mycobacterium sp. URHB0044]|jgi:acyl-CoA reductase-like NAD-dependent aldehyde dehydrogenase|uniref:hypothetical protein n=1 Tax=Mycobacterium sp. URHB0044 TaxID=1380386 RepID=UPI000AB14487|nr:hypothetical protein [Mycobacterium sp. URHB0044]